MKSCYVVGTFRPSTGRCHIRWNGVEFSTHSYEVLCSNSYVPGRTIHRHIRDTHVHGNDPISQLEGVLKVQTLHNPLKIPKFVHGPGKQYRGQFQVKR